MRNRSSRRGGRTWPALLAAGLILSGASCSLQDLVEVDLPPTTIDPELFETEEGALALYRGTLRAFRQGFGGPSGYIVPAGRMSDELTTGAYAGAGGQPFGELRKGDLNEIESRTMPEDNVWRPLRVENFYRSFNLARNQATDAIYYLSNFAPHLAKDLVGRLYAVRGYTMIFLAEAFCSGIPLTEYLSPNGMEYKPGSTTEEVFTRAVAQFDSAFASIADSVRFEYFAAVGKARALANLGKLDEAAEAVRDVPTGFEFKVLYADDGTTSSPNLNFLARLSSTSDPEYDFGTVADRKGTNGLPYVSANDPRLPLVPAPRQSSAYPFTRYMLPAKLLPQDAPWFGLSTESGKAGADILLASGIEARLYEAEALAARNDPGYLAILNELRTTCTDAATCPDPAPAGSGGVAGLPPLTDPGDQKARIKQVFDEHAFWLFLTGQRQGAMRRMVRVHGFKQDEVYPTGYFYWGGSYGSYTNLPIPGGEREINNLYKGCFHRDA